MSEGCVCLTEPGRNCPIFPHKNMLGNTYRLCRTRADYRAKWRAEAKGDKPQPRATTRTSSKCIYLGQELRDENGKAITRECKKEHG